ncbi:MAG: heme exporter protein CcmB, partial [Rhodocyclaceae bacterium]|nr:heme exporter protein CcmB [Rhodocyclaceae bacterium]
MKDARQGDSGENRGQTPISGAVPAPFLRTPLTVLRRDLLLTLRRPAELLTTLFFFIIVVSLFPLGIGPQPELL